MLLMVTTSVRFIFTLSLIMNRITVCHDFMMDFVAPNSNPALLSMTETGIYQCEYYADELDFQNEPVPACEDVTCPKDSQLIAYNPDLKKVSFLVTARYDGGGWFGTPAGGKEIYLGWPYDTVLQLASSKSSCCADNSARKRSRAKTIEDEQISIAT
ncbi:hypothetical protein PRIPAC_97224 [Pristionchus pacificus]|uniref:Uncharacterized protein n=1 Tax=Pristionchus pacificus TaxID=54126 RepID=A0A2A6D227_PRIPA|nr:hypothetical protein PRIPAC_97224 [Pristionchus pacificus]|eukprot:PDM84458.1 hypothetical protein PRIPAC_33481 [Pristionchus pacificus]